MMEHVMPIVWCIVALFGFGSAFSSIGKNFNNIEDVEKTYKCLQNDKTFKMELTQCYEGKLKGISKVDGTDISATIKTVCSLDDPTDCIADQLAKDSSCLSAKLIKTVNKDLKIIAAGYKYACDNDGERALGFIKDGGEQCFQDIGRGSRAFAECVEKDLAGAKQELEEVQDDEKKLEELTCKITLKLKDCFIKSLECNERSVEFLEGLFHVMLKESSCWKHVAGSSEVKAQSYYLSILMPIIALTFSK